MTIDNTPATLSLMLYGKNVTVKIDHSDLTTDELVETFYGMLITHGFVSKSIVEAMNGFVSELNDNE